MQKTFLLALMLSCASAHAETNVNDASDFHKAKGSPQLRYYLYGVYAAFGMVNADRAVNGGKKLYCQPAKLADAKLDIIAMVEQQLPYSEKNYQGGIKGLPIEFVLLDALQGTFPCEK